MAPFNKSTVLIAVLVVLAATLQPSAATRGAVRLSKSTTRPQFFFPIPTCVPGFPRWLLPCVDPAPSGDEPTECWSPITTLVPPCAEYLTNASVSSPPAACCDSFNTFIDVDGICLCHVSNGDIGKLLPAPLNFTQLFAMPDACRSHLRHIEDFSHCDSEVPPMTPPPMTSTRKDTPPAP